MKILTVCELGIVTSALLELNVKKVIKELGLDIDVEISNITLATEDKADFFVLSKRLKDRVNISSNKIILLDSILDYNELKNKIIMKINGIF